MVISAFLDRVSSKGRAAARATDSVLVLACALPPAHDADYRGSRDLAKRFCLSIEEAADTSLDRTRVAEIVRALFGADQRDWYVSIALVQAAGRRLRAFNCGLTGVARMATEGVTAILSPQTVARTLRERGGIVPPHTESIGATLGGATTSAEDIEYTEFEPACDEWVVLTASPVIMNSVCRLGSDRADRRAVPDRLNALADAMPESPDAAIVGARIE